jgi:hypothetical protein
LEEHSELGEDLRRALAARGRELSLAEARRLALALIDLLRADLLEPAGDCSPVEGGHAYNMAPFQYETEGESPC